MRTLQFIMEIRIFQILIPSLAVLAIVYQIWSLKNEKSTIFEVFIFSIFWLTLSLLSFYPDFFSNSLANLLGIKDNTNAIIFAALGLIFYLQYRLYKILKKQDKILTDFIRKDALNNAKDDVSPE